MGLINFKFSAIALQTAETLTFRKIQCGPHGFKIGPINIFDGNDKYTANEEYAMIFLKNIQFVLNAYSDMILLILPLETFIMILMI